MNANQGKMGLREKQKKLPKWTKATRTATKGAFGDRK